MTQALCTGEENTGYDDQLYVQEKSVEAVTVRSMSRRGAQRL